MLCRLSFFLVLRSLWFVLLSTGRESIRFVVWRFIFVLSLWGLFGKVPEGHFWWSDRCLGPFWGWILRLMTFLNSLIWIFFISRIIWCGAFSSFVMVSSSIADSWDGNGWKTDARCPVDLKRQFISGTYMSCWSWEVCNISDLLLLPSSSLPSMPTMRTVKFPSHSVTSPFNLMVFAVSVVSYTYPKTQVFISFVFNKFVLLTWFLNYFPMPKLHFLYSIWFSTALHQIFELQMKLLMYLSYLRN